MDGLLSLIIIFLLEPLGRCINMKILMGKKLTYFEKLSIDTFWNHEVVSSLGGSVCPNDW